MKVAEPSKRCSDGERQINHMKSFSRTPSPAHASQSSSTSSIPPIYECLERLTQPKVYRSRLSLYRHVNKDPPETPYAKARVQSGDKEHYASLMVELENSFCKKETTNSYAVAPSSTSKSSTPYCTSCCNDSLIDTTDLRHRESDAEFSKELEAALNLIQELESPNTIDTPSETCKAEDSLGKRRRSQDDKNDSDSTRTLSGSSSLDTHGKIQKTLPVESQSTSGYNSPSLDQSSRLTPTTGESSSDLTLSQENGLSCVIRHMGDTAVISLFSPTKEPHPYPSTEKIPEINTIEREFVRNHKKDNCDKRTKSLIELKTKSLDAEEKFAKAKIRRWKHFIERKRRPSLLPEVESAIVKSECLAFLSERELKDHLNQTKTIHRVSLVALDSAKALFVSGLSPAILTITQNN